MKKKNSGVLQYVRSIIIFKVYVGSEAIHSFLSPTPADAHARMFDCASSVAMSFYYFFLNF